MKPDVINKLNRLNRDFYQQTGPAFDTTRQSPWPGWHQLLPYINQNFDLNSQFKLLDLGAGNGRFGQFLLNQGYNNFDYTGIEPEPYFIKKASQNLSQLSKVNLIPVDLVNTDPLDNLPQNTFDLVVGFGLLHHLPGNSTRNRLINQALLLTKPGGLLTFSFWRFNDDPGFQSKLVPADRLPIKLSQQELEPGDFFLDFHRANNLRYCHSFDESELKQLENLSQSKLLDRFDADGKTNHLNTYLIYEKLA